MAAERDPHLHRRNATRRDYAGVAGVIELFEAQVERTPDAVAVRFGTHAYTYRELNARAGRLANRLRSLGVRPETLVPIFFNRSAEMILALLAVLKAGGAYVPLDSNLPRERIRFMLEETGARVVLTESALLSSLPLGTATAICVDRPEVEASSPAEAQLSGRAAAENLAYVIFTSGSTGLPKGVAITHGSLLNYTCFIVEKLALRSAERQYQFGLVSTIAADLGNTCLFPCLVSGGCLHVIPYEVCTDGGRFAEYCAQNRIDILKIVPSHLLALLKAGDAKAVLPRRVLICGGEALPPALVEQVFRASDCAVINHYGPTETTVGSLVFDVPRGEDPGECVPIGRPIANTRIYVLDEQRRPVPIGVAGELYIGGAGVARGYLNRPELTAERFVPSPFLGEEEDKLYRTGDLVRVRSDGNVVFVGRIDHQVKIHGFRVEPGEVESVLAGHPQVYAAVVIARERGSGDRTLIAYLVPKGKKRPELTKLRKYLKERLPEYMVPAAFEFFDSLPVTATGKLDRAALVSVEKAADLEPKRAREPSDAVELRLLTIWRELFGLRDIGVQDDFFELGGSSVLAGALFARIRRSVGQDLSPAELLRAPTIALLAARLRGGATPQKWTSLVPIQTEGIRPALFCVHGGAGTILFYYDLAQLMRPEWPVYGLQAQGLYGDAAPHATIEEMSSHYLEEIRTVQPKGPYFLAGFCSGAVIVFEMAQQLTRNGEEVGLLASFDGGRPGYRYPSASHARLPQCNSRSWSERVAFHRARVRELGPRYIKDKVSYRCRLVIERRAYELGRWCSRHGRPIPGFARESFFRWSIRKAELAYRPHPFPGRMNIFETKGLFPDPRLGWEELVQGGLEIHEIAGEHRFHRDLMSGEFVPVVALQLRRLLSRDAVIVEKDLTQTAAAKRPSRPPAAAVEGIGGDERELTISKGQAIPHESSTPAGEERATPPAARGRPRRSLPTDPQHAFVRGRSRRSTPRA